MGDWPRRITNDRKEAEMARDSERASDEEIINWYWNREEKAITKTDIKYGQFLFQMAYRILHDRMDSEECKNDTYLGIWNTIPPARPAVFPAFIAAILRRIAINRYRERRAQKRIPSELTLALDECEGLLFEEETADSRYDAKEIGRLLSRYVGELSERQRYIFIERFYMAEPVKNITDDLGIGAATVYRELEKIKEGLKTYLEKNEVYL